MNKVAKFCGPILIDEGLIKKKTEDGGKMAKNKEAKDLIVLWMGLIRCPNERVIRFGSQFN